MKQNVRFSKLLKELPFLDRSDDFFFFLNIGILILLALRHGFSSLLQYHFMFILGSDLPSVVQQYKALKQYNGFKMSFTNNFFCHLCSLVELECNLTKSFSI